jgi:hypothetical protein
MEMLVAEHDHAPDIVEEVLNNSDRFVLPAAPVTEREYIASAFVTPSCPLVPTALLAPNIFIEPCWLIRENDTATGRTIGSKYIVPEPNAADAFAAINGIGSNNEAVYPDTAPVTVEPFSPKLIPFEFEKTTFERLVEVEPALTLIAVRLVAIDAVRVPTPAPVLRPKDTPLLLLNVMAERAFDVPPPAETFSA